MTGLDEGAAAKPADPEMDISVIVVTLARKTLYKLLSGIFSQETDRRFEVILILQGELDTSQLKNIDTRGRPLRIIRKPFGLGVGRYRNEGIRQAWGGVLVFVDDDEWPADSRWLNDLTGPVFAGNALVTTSGTRIPETGCYLVDCIGLLGFPGGANLGFEKVWPVTGDGWTDHLCTGNFAFSRKAAVRFNEGLKTGAEDNDLADRLREKDIRIKYVRSATIWHVPRQGMADFIKWHFHRGGAIAEFMRHSSIGRSHVSGRGRAVVNTISSAWNTRFFPGVCFLLVMQYTVTLCGFFRGMVRN